MTNIIEASPVRSEYFKDLKKFIELVNKLIYYLEAYSRDRNRTINNTISLQQAELFYRRLFCEYLKMYQLFETVINDYFELSCTNETTQNLKDMYWLGLEFRVKIRWLLDNGIIKAHRLNLKEEEFAQFATCLNLHKKILENELSKKNNLR